MNGGVPIARVLGVEIRVSLTLAMLLAVVTILGAEQAAVTTPDLGFIIHWLVGGITALLFLASVVGHELAHALTGRRHGVATPVVVLGFIGALAPASIQAGRPRDELAIAVAGPFLSLAVAAVLLPAAVALDGQGPALTAVAGALLVVGGMNLILGVLSLMPGLPLDGGRIVRALAWARTGDRDRAARVTALVGRGLGWTVVGLGTLLLLVGRLSEGMLMVALGWLLSGGSKTLDRRLDLEQALRGATAADAMVEDAPRVPAGLTLDTFAAVLAAPDGPSAAAVMSGDQVVGVVGLARLRKLGARRQMTMHASEAMSAPPAAPFLDRSAALWDVIDILNSRALEALAVVDEGRLVGLVTRDSVATVIRARMPDLQIRASRTRRR